MTALAPHLANCRPPLCRSRRGPAVVSHNAPHVNSLKVKGRLRSMWCERSFRVLAGGESDQVGGLDHPGSSRTDLPTFDFATPQHPQCRHVADPDHLCGSLESDLAALGPFAVAMARNH